SSSRTARHSSAGDSGSASKTHQAAPQAVSTTPTFGEPTISGVQGNGFEEDLRLDPSDPNRVYTSSPGSLSSTISWIWTSKDGGKTFEWVPNATPLQGKLTT